MQDRLLDEYVGRIEEAIRQERADLAKKIIADESKSLFRLDRVFSRRLEAIGKREGTSTYDATISLLLDGYEWLHRGGALPSFRPRAFAVGTPEPRHFLPHLCMIRQTTKDRLVAMRPVEGVVAEHDSVMAVARLLDTYEWLMEGGLAEKVSERMVASESSVRIEVDAQLMERLDEIGEEEGNMSLDETLDSLIGAYDLLYRSGLFKQLKTLASTVVSSFDLDEDDQEALSEVSVREGTEYHFSLIQELLLFYVRDTELKRETTKRAAGGKGDEASLEESEGKAVPLAILQDVPGWWQVPAWWQRRWFEHPDAIVEKARMLLTSSLWSELVVGLTVTTGRCLTEVLKTGVVSPQSASVLRFAAYSRQGNGMEASFEISILVESSLVLQAWEKVRNLNDCRALDAQEVCERYRSFVL